MRIFLILIAYLIINVTPVFAALDIDVSEPNLEITTGFSGDTLTLFGTANPRGDIVIIVRGPLKKTNVVKKADIMGLWIQGETISFVNVPSYYNVASTRPVFQIAPEEIRIENNIGINSLQFATNDKNIQTDVKQQFQEALIQNKQLSGLYSLTPNAITFVNETLFKTKIYMPSNVPIGQYEINAFLFDNGQIIDTQSRPFEIRQGGLAGAIHDYANDSPLLYGLTTIAIALLSSLIAVTLLRRE